MPATGDQLAVADYIYPLRPVTADRLRDGAADGGARHFTIAGLSGISPAQQALVTAALTDAVPAKDTPLATTSIEQSDCDGGGERHRRTAVVRDHDAVVVADHVGGRLYFHTRNGHLPDGDSSAVRRRGHSAGDDAAAAARPCLAARSGRRMLSALFLALAPTYVRNMASAAQVLVDASPATTSNLLVEWEKSLGLPDACTAANPSIEQRQAAVRAKWGARGSLTIAYFIALAANLGYTVTITEFTPFTVDMPWTCRCCEPEWAFIWQVSAPAIVTFYFSVDESSVDDPLEDL